MSTTPKHPSTYDRLLARERLITAPPPAKGDVTDHEVIFVDLSGIEQRVLKQISLPAKEDCTHPRVTRTGRCFHCGVIVADLA